MFRKVLIANRGEIAVRIIKACQELKIQTVAVYSEVDARARHTLLADEAVNLGPANPAESYLNPAKIITAAKRTACEAIHPGYGFLSENAAFAEAVQAAGLTFIGPSAEAIRTMGDKTAARRLMQDAGVPVVPGFDSQDPQADFAAAAEEIGYPILVKAAAGGGGKGMRIVQTPDDLAYALEAAQREAQNAFGDPRLYLEKYLPHPRHIEFQILADQQGAILHLFERECSIQRRHQKIIEETPSPFLDASLRQIMAEAAIAAAAAVGYVNAGTVEFLVVAAPSGDRKEDQEGGSNFYFLEMNTRLQVEHPITEAVTGIDLVQAQLLVADGQPLPIAQADIGQRGHAIECRIYAEDPANNFLPASGPILQVVEPAGVGVRVDSGLECGAEVTVHYDPLLAKLIIHAANREAAIRKMDWALQQYVILGVTTNIPFLRAVINHPEFMAGRTNTHFLENYFATWPEDQPAIPDLALIVAALCDQLSALQPPPWPPRGGSSILTPLWGVGGGGDPHSPWQISDGFRIGGNFILTPLWGAGGGEYKYQISGSDKRLTIRLLKENETYRATINGREYLISDAYLTEGQLYLTIDGRQKTIPIAGTGRAIFVALDGWTYQLEKVEDPRSGGRRSDRADRVDHRSGRRRPVEGATSSIVEANMPGIVRAVLVAEGEAVHKNQPLILLEAMKMELRLTAPHDGVVQTIRVQAGQLVQQGEVLIRLA